MLRDEGPKGRWRRWSVAEQTTQIPSEGNVDSRGLLLSRGDLLLGGPAGAGPEEEGGTASTLSSTPVAFTRPLFPA